MDAFRDMSNVRSIRLTSLFLFLYVQMSELSPSLSLCIYRLNDEDGLYMLEVTCPHLSYIEWV